MKQPTRQKQKWESRKRKWEKGQQDHWTTGPRGQRGNHETHETTRKGATRSASLRRGVREDFGGDFQEGVGGLGMNHLVWILSGSEQKRYRLASVVAIGTQRVRHCCSRCPIRAVLETAQQGGHRQLGIGRELLSHLCERHRRFPTGLQVRIIGTRDQHEDGALVGRENRKACKEVRDLCASRSICVRQMCLKRRNRSAANVGECKERPIRRLTAIGGIQLVEEFRNGWFCLATKRRKSSCRRHRPVDLSFESTPLGNCPVASKEARSKQESSCGISDARIGRIKRRPLDEKWQRVCADGADCISTFVADRGSLNCGIDFLTVDFNPLGQRFALAGRLVTAREQCDQRGCHCNDRHRQHPLSPFRGHGEMMAGRFKSRNKESRDGQQDHGLLTSDLCEVWRP